MNPVIQNILEVLLEEAVKNWGKETIDFLVSLGADIFDNNYYYNEDSLLHIAAMNDNVKAAEALLERGFDIDIRDNLENTALMMAADFNSLKIAELLINKGADINAVSSGEYSALTYAAHKKDLSMARMLVEHGADPHVIDVDGKTLLFHAMENETMYRYLETLGVDPDRKNFYGESAAELKKRRRLLKKKT